MDAAELAVELTRLNAQKLRSEIRELNMRWWQRPAWVAAIATVTAAFVGLTWAIANGVFENRKRELWIETHDLEVRRNAQSKQFEREKAQYATQLSELKQRVEQLRSDVQKLDVPVVSDADILDSPWEPGARAGDKTTLWIDGINFGSRPGTVQLAWFAVEESARAYLMFPLKVGPVQPKIASWSQSAVKVELPTLNKELLREAVQAAAGHVAGFPGSLKIGMAVTITRNDSRVSARHYLAFREAMEWLFPK
jgi:hypothetical protein